MRGVQTLRRRTGISLIEGMVASTLLLGTLVAIAQTWPLQAAAVAQARNLSCATQLAQERMEETLAGGDAAAGETRGSVAVESAVNGVPVTVTYTWTVTVTDLSPAMRAVAVQVQWTEQGVARSVPLETLQGHA